MKTNLYFALACLLLLTPAPAGFAEDVIKLPEKGHFHLFLLVGQSNMAGRGKVSLQDTIAHPRVLTLTKDNQWKHAVDPIHFDKKVAGVGLGRTFGILMAEATPNSTIGLIPCAAGGSPIATWTPGGYHDQTKSHPYDDAIKRTRIASTSGTLKAILWHQGESDSTAQRSPVYEERLHELIARFRTEFEQPEIPFIVGQLGQFPERPWSPARKLVDLAHRSLPEKIANTQFVASDGLVHKGDETHFDAAGYRELGRRYAETYQALTQERDENTIR